MAAPLAEVLERAGAVLGELQDADLDGLADDTLTDAVQVLQRLRGSLESAEAAVLSRWDAQGCWRASGAKTGSAWLAWRQRLPIQVARQRLRHARALRTLPAVAEAWASGDVDRAHLSAMLGVRTARTAEVFDAGHQTLLDLARTSTFTHFKRACDHWELAVDPDGAEQGADGDRASREVHLSRTFGGMWFGRMTLDPISGEIINTTLREIERELFEADWAEAKERLGRPPLVMDLTRTPAQRRADAMVDMAVRARTAPAGGRRPAPLFSVVVGLETLMGPVLELFNRTVITPGTAARYLTGADVERIVFDPPSRVVDVGSQRRFFRGALRRAIEVRDRTCFHPTCDEVPQRLEVDHIHEAAKGGQTTQDNGRGGCGFHNRWRNTHPDPNHHDPNEGRAHPPPEGAGQGNVRSAIDAAAPQPRVPRRSAPAAQKLGRVVCVASRHILSAMLCAVFVGCWNEDNARAEVVSVSVDPAGGYVCAAPDDLRVAARICVELTEKQLSNVVVGDCIEVRLATRWPTSRRSLTAAEEDRVDLERHEAEMVDGRSFNYAIFDASETELLGCVYIDPPPAAGTADAVVSWWVVDHAGGGRLEADLAELIPRWLAESWPFTAIRYGT